MPNKQIIFQGWKKGYKKGWKTELNFIHIWGMNLNEFVESFACCFSENESKNIHEATEFRKLTEWNSMMALILISHIDEVFNVMITADDIRTSNTVADLYNKLKQA